MNSKNFQDIISNISKSFKDYDDSSLKKASLISGSLMLGSSIITSISTSTFGLTLGYLGVIYSGIVFVPLIGAAIYYWWKDTNSEKINEYFDGIIKELNKIKGSFLKSIKEKKDDFIEQLEKKDSISSEEIKALKELNFPKNLDELIKLFN